MFTKDLVVIGLPNNGYGITSDQCLLKVIDAYEINGENFFTGEITDHMSDKSKSTIGDVYENLPENCFRAATAEEINNFKVAKIKPKKEKAAEEFRLRAGLTIKTYEDGRIESTFNKLRELKPEVDPDRLKALVKIIEQVRGLKPADCFNFNITDFAKGSEFECFEDFLSEKARKKTMNSLVDFFKEFQFEPNFRMVNTLCLRGSKDLDEAIEYIANYFNLTTSPYVSAIKDKMKSPEFKEIVYSIALSNPTQIINKRFKVYYGSQGTGKTTKAMEETEGRCVICNNSILPSDLIEDFNFNDGKAGFNQSMLRKCMEEGKTITLDEINLLPFETIRFLQGILDDKKQFNWKGEVIKINDGFGIIGTLNLVVNGMSFGLPEPLVDRASEIKEFHLTGDNLFAALI